MKRSAQILVRMYTHLLSLYPRRYRAEYGEELQAVFGLVVNEATQQSMFSIIRLGWRELRDLPGAAIREHWQERGKRRVETKTRVPPTVVTMAPTAYWLENGWVNVPGAIIAGVIVVVVMFSPVLVGLLRRLINSARAA